MPVKTIEFEIPHKWRKGQFLFNFLEFVKSKGVTGNQNARLADTFHLSDEEIEKYYTEFNQLYGTK